MYEVKWMPKTETELEELCNNAEKHGFYLVACTEKFCVFRSVQQSVQADECPEGGLGGLHDWFPPKTNYSQYCSKCGIRR